MTINHASLAIGISFRMGTQKMSNFHETSESTGETERTCIRQFETAMGNELMCMHVCDDVVFSISEEIGLTISEVKEPPPRVSDIKHKTRKGLWEGAIKVEFKGLVDLNALSS